MNTEHEKTGFVKHLYYN